MRTLLALTIALAIHASPEGEERRSRLESDECSRRTAACEQGCESRGGMSRLECKTDCRLAETQCRNGAQRSVAPPSLQDPLPRGNGSPVSPIAGSTPGR